MLRPTIAHVVGFLSLHATLVLAAGPAESHKGLFYANDFSYLTAPANTDFALGDSFKRLSFADGDLGVIDFGGQIRERFHHERGMGRVPTAGVPRFQDTDTNFVLTRLRLYSNWQVTEDVRFFAEAIYADASDDDDNYVPRPIDRNWGDMLNLFVDLKLTDSVTARVGRQELLYGNQRLVSPLDWANTRRTFEGINFLYGNGDWKIDSFFTALVEVDPADYDEADDDQKFYGCYAVYSGFENFTVDAYYLGLDNNQPFDADFATATQYQIHTVGLRFNGAIGSWLWEAEGGPQWGEYDGAGIDHAAGFATGGLGYKAADYPWKPTLWVYCDYASGNVPGGDFNGFNHLYPLGHKYFGFIDAVQRSNIISPNILLTSSPGANWNLLMWFWHFEADSETPVPSIGNTPPQNASKDLGDELDVLLTYRFGPRCDISLGWSHFWVGDKISEPAVDADFIYSQWQLNF